MTPELLVELIEEMYRAENPRDRDCYDLWAWGNFEEWLPLTLSDGSRVELVDYKDTGTREDFTDPEPVYNVVRVTSPAGLAEYFRRDGVVQSWEGDEMGDWYRVVPEQITITVYEKRV